MDVETSDFLSVLKFFRYVRKHFRIIVPLFLLLSLVSLYLVNRYRVYESSVRFVVNNLPVTDVTQNRNNIDGDLESWKNNSLELFFSTEAIDHIIDKFNLYASYKINRTSPFAHERLIEILRSSIHIQHKKETGYILVFSSRDRTLSASFANALMDETDKLNRRLMEEEFSRKVAMMNNLILRSHENAGRNNPNLVQNIQSLEELKKFLELQNTKSSEQKELESRLYNVLALLQQNLEDMTRSRDYYDVVMKNYLSDNYRFFYVVSKAVPDFNDYLVPNILTGSGIGLAVTLMISIFVYYVRGQLSNLSVLGLYSEKSTRAHDSEKAELAETRI